MQKFPNIQQPYMPDRSVINTTGMETGKADAVSISRGFKVLDICLLLLPFLGLFLWSISLRTISLNEMNDLGLISALPPGMIAAPGLLVVSIIFTLQRPKVRVWLLVFQFMCIILMLYGIPHLMEEVPCCAPLYRHAGYTDYILQTGTVDPYLDIYFNWPGFFVLSAFFTKVFGYATILTYAGLAPVFFNMMYLGPMYAIFSSITSNKRLAWLSLLFFIITNWVGQDYFSPQGLDFFLYLVIIMMLLKWFRMPPKKQVPPGKDASFVQKSFAWLKTPDSPSPSIGHWQRGWLLCCLILVYGLVVCSHPLTPFFTLFSVFALVLFRRCYPFWLPILMTAMTAAWILLMARPYFSQHISLITDTIGHLTGNVPKSITAGKMVGDPLYQVVAKMRLYTTVLLWLMALLGAIKRMRQGNHDITCILLALAGFPLIATQSYGGEMLMRIYLFTEPFMCLFAASLFFGKSMGTAPKAARVYAAFPWRTAAIMVASLILLGSFFFTRYGDVRSVYISTEEWHAIQYLYQVAPPRAFILESWNQVPLYFENYSKYDIQMLGNSLPETVRHTDTDAIVWLFENKHNRNSYIIFSQEQQINATSWYGLPRDALPRLETALLQTGRFKLIYGNSDTQILQFIG